MDSNFVVVFNHLSDQSPLVFVVMVVITLTAKRRRKSTVIILCVCLQNFGKSTNIGGSNELLVDFKLYKDQK